jgi:hypothetical protein
MKSIRAFAMVPTLALALMGASCLTSGSAHSPRRMADGKQWTVDNLNVNIGSSYCYEDAEPNLPSKWPFVYVGISAAGMFNH